MKEKIIPIDTFGSGKAPHVRHRAVVNSVRRPVGNRILNSQIALTVCGRAISNFFTAEKVSLNFTDGRVYAKECARCHRSESK